jgi:hypothetical protein
MAASEERRGWPGQASHDRSGRIGVARFIFRRALSRLSKSATVIPETAQRAVIRNPDANSLPISGFRVRELRSRPGMTEIFSAASYSRLEADPGTIPQHPRTAQNWNFLFPLWRCNKQFDVRQINGLKKVAGMT